VLFNSYEFIFIFLPIVLSGFLLLRYFGYHKLIPSWLLVSSAFFYGDFKLWHLPLLIAMILINYYFALKIERSSYKKRYFFIAIALDISILAWFKYASLLPILDSIKPDTLPLGISFYTFQIIAYLADIYQGRAKRLKLSDFALFILFFPQLIAGPIVHYAQMVPQFDSLAKGKTEIYFSNGLALFIIGLGKKVLLADTLSPFVDRAFGVVASGGSLDMISAWEGIIAYSMQIYFDFSAYSEMAIGLALMFGLRLPINFNSPYKAIDIRDFWRRWHITLSTFIRDYLYIPLGGSKKGDINTIKNLIVVMTIAGAWHGSGWTFVTWGFLHGVWLGLSHIKSKFIHISLPKGINIFVTFIGITLLWVLFRSNSLDTALLYYKFLFTGDITDTHLLAKDYIVSFVLLTTLFIVWFLPNAKEATRYIQDPNQELPQPSVAIAILCGILLIASLKALSEGASHSFIYFMF